MRKSRLICFVVLAVIFSGSAGAVDEIPPGPSFGERLDSWLDNEYYKISLNIRARTEIAKQTGLDRSAAHTVRTRLGVGSKPWHGFSGFVEMENINAANDERYFDVVSTPNGKTVIADPRETELNQAFVRYSNPELFGVGATAGRQRIILDDARFIGNVGWRQNEQTYDAAQASTSLGVDGLQLTYGFIDEVHRIFGDDGPAATRDFDSKSHFGHISYAAHPLANVVGFAYLFDFDNSPGNSSNSYGMRMTGSKELNPKWKVNYAASYAYQIDAADNPVDYDAHYAAFEGGASYGPLGSLAAGYELLGSDDGKARFVTPLATAHKFNGWADAFLNNGGPNGLQDLYVSFGPKLPLKLSGKLVYHQFWSHENSNHIGEEIDVILKRPITKQLSALTKGAYFNGKSPGPADRWRWWLELTFNY